MINIPLPRLLRSLALLSLLAALAHPLFAASPALAPAWTPVAPEELALKTASVEPGADAEAIFWDVRIEDSLEVTGGARTDTWNHVRVKVLTDRGKEAWTRIDIPYEGRTRIADLAARTIRPDGSIVEAGKDAVSDRTLLKAGGVKRKARSVAMPGVEVGSLVEYRWREIESDAVSFFTHLVVEREIPIQVARFAFKPLNLGGWMMQTRTFGVSPAPFERDKDGFSVTSVTNVRSVREEPFMPPADTLRAWILVTYTDQKEGASPDEYWRAFGRRLGERYKDAIRPGGDAKRAAAEAIGPETDPRKKLERLFAWCRTKLRNVDAPGAKTTFEEREKIAKDENPSSVLSRSAGTSAGIDMAFVALANAAGFEARVARVGDRSTFFFDPSQTSVYFMRRVAAAAKVGEEWLFFSPGTPWVANGQLPWWEEDEQALLCDPKEPRFVHVAPTLPARNGTRRTAKLRLDPEGTLEGTVRVEATGQSAVQRRTGLADTSPDEIEKAVREEITDRFPAAEVSAVSLEDRDAPERPLVVAYKLKIPGFAARAGSRLLLTPSLFRKGRTAAFPSSKREQSVFFPFATTDEDEVVVEVPERFGLEEPVSPPAVKVLGSKGEYKASVSLEGRTLTYRRAFRLAGGTFGVVDYAAIKKAFDRIQSADEVTVALAKGP